VNEDVKVGQFSAVTIGLPQETNEEMRNGGMIKARKVAMGYEHPDLQFTMTAFDPATLKLVTGKPGTENPFMITGAHVDEDGATHSAVLYVRGRLVTADGGDWKPGEVAELECSVVQNYAKLEIDGAEIFEIDDFDYSVGGVSQTGDIRAALLL
jgi:P2 family phage contractile tail tube protein